MAAWLSLAIAGGILIIVLTCGVCGTLRITRRLNEILTVMEDVVELRIEVCYGVWRCVAPQCSVWDCSVAVWYSRVVWQQAALWHPGNEDR